MVEPAKGERIAGNWGVAAGSVSFSATLGLTEAPRQVERMFYFSIAEPGSGFQGDGLNEIHLPKVLKKPVEACPVLKHMLCARAR